MSVLEHAKEKVYKRYLFGFPARKKERKVCPIVFNWLHLPPE